MRFNEGTCDKERLWGEPRGLAWVARGERSPGPSQSWEWQRDFYLGETDGLWFREGLERGTPGQDELHPGPVFLEYGTCVLNPWDWEVFLVLLCPPPIPRAFFLCSETRASPHEAS